MNCDISIYIEYQIKINPMYMGKLVNNMAKCKICGASLADEVVVCPICDSNQPENYYEGLDNIDKKLSSSPSLFFKKEQEDNIFGNAEGMEFEVERLLKRGEDCFKSGKAWLGAKDRTRARKEFQRAFKYYETVLKIDPDNEVAREARTKCLFKMA